MASLQKELQESRQALEAAQSEVECLREMVAGWEEAFAKAQQDLEALKVRRMNFFVSHAAQSLHGKFNPSGKEAPAKAQQVLEALKASCVNLFARCSWGSKTCRGPLGCCTHLQLSVSFSMAACEFHSAVLERGPA